MLTHNPDYNRFNVEDSINKQFQLKVSLLVYMSDNDTDLASLKRRLKEIYHVRSNIAHGNFGELAKAVKVIQKKDGEDEYRLEGYVGSLYQYVRVVIEMFLKDRAFIKFLKEA